MNHPPSDRSRIEKTNIAFCHFEWQFADSSLCSNIYAAHDQGKDVFAVVLVTSSREVVYREHRSHCHIDDAWSTLKGGRPGSWKTVKVLICLRQALREQYVQCMPLDRPKLGIGVHAFRAWLRKARAYDTVHHGEPTF